MKSHSVISVCMYVKVCVRQRETERQRKTERESMRVDVCNNYTPTSRCVKESFQLQPPGISTSIIMATHHGTNQHPHQAPRLFQPTSRSYSQEARNLYLYGVVTFCLTFLFFCLSSKPARCV